ncbi:ABC transporter substrate-binding protein [Bradyrhizobium sp. U87765 SZCCT0131]|uniref:ABC transporter substrate-binding protein n=1 Tax=unclassified Bradyrhizobium TaxID=2631580 RepID=UPI001BA69BDE|nr:MULTISPECIES: ABC transporter substrate-binding protein [unclassified Bradyrhizobium]MBR1221802.1 ABC transporter substrate-binding protein [Bradyrhizobium sp. U87765 SZCCT0131]MBR1264000.1 ABC transporter substrate-binding protein [Bradyrhizobium sp. U87765 SZCCT0134]MBR1308217.1 ABC transporter substrate-binding protein [Bradyrhizobium sp. U87765 SZCCT0110]MBR1320250.1 ABC transporter substrate-binding protein [Bradyrhizobium sp. U87765 SZCCT0109]MBR1348637.1 ABC transporter substrate-bin
MIRRGMFLAGVAALAMVSGAARADDLIIGFSMAKTGPYVSLANTNEVAVDLAVDEINAKGGIDGKKIKLVKFDTGGDPKQAALAVRQFAEDNKALAVIGPFSSGEVRVAFPAGERLGIVQMSMSSSAPALTKDFSYAFRNTRDERMVIDQVLAALRDKKLPMTNGATAYATDDTVSKSVGTTVLPGLFNKYGINPKGAVDFQYNAFDLSPQVSQLAQMKPDIIGLGAPPEAAINLAKELKRQGVVARVVGGTTVADPDLPQRMEGAGDGMTIGTTFFADLNDRTRAFAKEFGVRTTKAGIARHEPNQQDASAYDIVYLYAEAIKRAGATGAADKVVAERTAIRDALSKLRGYAALEGEISFGEDRDSIKPIYVVEAKGGRWTLLDTRHGE